MLRGKPPRLYAKNDTRCNGAKVTRLLHRILLPDADEKVDHKNGNTLDNRTFDEETELGNIRPATNSENARNARKVKKLSSRFKGVHWDKARQRWLAQIRGVNSKTRHLGRFMTEEDAARCYDLAAIQYFGSWAVLNFPAEPKTLLRSAPVEKTVAA